MRQKIAVWTWMLLMLLGLTGCNGINEDTSGKQNTGKGWSSEPETTPTPTPEVKKDALVVGGYGLSGAFHPIYGEGNLHEADEMVNDLIFSSVCKRGKDGEILDDLGQIKPELIENSNGTSQIKYTITLQEGLKFSDGEKITIDDVLFTYYVCLDPSYAGDWELQKLPIVGLNAYWFDRAYFSDALYELDHKYSEEVITKEDFIQYLVESKLDGWFDDTLPGDADGNGLSWADYLTSQGYDTSGVKTAEEMLAMLADCEYAYHSSEYNPQNYYKRKMALEGLQDGISVENIAGIQKIDDRTCTILLDQASSKDLELLGLLPILPEHYYGKKTEKGNMDAVERLAKAPIGSGPFVLKSFQDGIAVLERNTEYSGDAPVQKKIEVWDMEKFGRKEKEGSSTGQNAANHKPEASLQYVENKTVDLLFTEDTKAYYDLADKKNLGIKSWEHPGYGYMGIQAKKIRDTDVRKGIMYLVQRSKAIDYYSGMAEVLERPMDPTLYEYPENAKEYYSYDMKKAEACFQSAGYQKVGGELKRDGKKLILRAGITSMEDHPAASILEALQKDLKSIGGELIIQIFPYETLVSKVMNNDLDLWVLAWEDSKDCDLTDMFSSNGEENLFGLSSPELDAALTETASAYDQQKRKELVEKELEMIMESAVCLPVYNRKDLFLYAKDSIQEESLALPKRGSWKFLADVAFINKNPS